MFEKRSLGIAFESDGTVRAAELTSSMRGITLSRMWSIEPEGTDSFDSWTRALDRLREAGADMDNIVIGIPDSLVYRKHLNFPFSNRKRIMQILNSELEGEIPLSVDAVVADFIGGSEEDGGIEGIAVACDKATLARFLDLLGPGARLQSVQTGSVGLAVASLRAGLTNGVSVRCSSSEAVLIEFRSSKVKSIKRLVLTGDHDRDSRFLVEWIGQHTVSEDEVYIGCGDLNPVVRAGLNGETTLGIRLFTDLDIVQRSAGTEGNMEIGAAASGLALGGLGIREAVPFDLRKGSFKPVTPLAGLKAPVLRSAGLLVLVGLLAVATLATGLNRSRKEFEQTRGQLESEFTDLLPGSKPVRGQEAAQVKGELENLKKKMADVSGLEGRGALSVLAALSAAVPKDVPLKLDELSYDSSKLRFEGSVTSFDAVDRIKAALEAEPLFDDVQVQNARVGANIDRVTFRLQMEVR